ncbi:hypothetical protein Tsp_02305 [Trichinella spiralis]|uniref:hypothetical protein n=1 Tax=Trichinella spiralis TaxID=6334 RepID=UPI0001EFCCB5|nr:hypothetical protein Tsp_02305 [Trichinella spiralis]
MFRQFLVSLCQVAVHRGRKGENGQMWMGGWTRRKVLHHKWPGWVSFLPRSAFSKSPFFHFVCQVLIHWAAFDVIILLDHRCHVKVCPYSTTTAYFVLYQNTPTINNEGHTVHLAHTFEHLQYFCFPARFNLYALPS